MFETNFFGAVYCLQVVTQSMRKTGGGTIINISSVAGHIPVPFMVPYCATKFALNAIGHGARMELKRGNINVLTVCPGYVQTDFGAHVVADKGGRVRPKVVKGVTTERVARAAYAGYRKRKREVVVPWTMIPAMKLHQLFPALVEWALGRAIK
jgi:short-subunit dehydrogenase